MVVQEMMVVPDNQVVQVLEEVILKNKVVTQLNQHNQAIVVVMDLVTQVGKDITQVLQRVLKVEEAEVPAVPAVTLVLTLVQMAE